MKLTAVLLIMTIGLFGQTPGAIVFPASPIVSHLNPNGDSWTTSFNGAYVSNDQTESEIEWVSIVQFDAEPNNDLQTGGSCGNTDIMDNPSTGADASYVYFLNPDGIEDNGDEYMLYRLRIAKNPGNGNFGFSVLMDIDSAFGTSDSDSLLGNPGFEVEIRVVNGGGSKGVYVDDVDGTTSGTNVGVYSLITNSQRSYALTTLAACSSNDPIFYDFMIPFSILSTNFGMTGSTAVRLVGATSINGASVLGSTASDIAGIDDDNYANSVAGQDEAFSDFVNNQNPVPSKGAVGGGVFLPVELSTFKGETRDGSNYIFWETMTETNNDYFQIEKSTEGSQFQVVGTQLGQGNSENISTYSFVDNGNSAKTYYRLKQVDFDGKFKYSNTIKVGEGSSEIENGIVRISNTIQVNEQGLLMVFSLEGKMVFSKTMNINEVLDTQDFSGVFIAQLNTESGVQKIKFVSK